MNIIDIIQRRRTIRRFKQKKIRYKDLRTIVNAARFAPTAANLQPWKFLVVDDISLSRKLFAFLRWAAYLAPNGTPSESESPTAYIIVLQDMKIRSDSAELDIGAAIQTMLLVAEEMNIGSAWICSIDKKGINRLFHVPKTLCVSSVIAFGYKAESSTIAPLKKSIRYWKDSRCVMHVPKRSLRSVMFHNSIIRSPQER